MSKRSLLVLALASALFVPATGHSFPTAAPYPGGSASGDCYYLSHSAQASCEHVEHIDASGALDVKLEFASRGDGLLPGETDAYSAARFEIPFTLDMPASAVTVRASFHIDEATLEVVRTLGGVAPESAGPLGSIQASVGLHGFCVRCIGHTSVDIVSTDNPMSVENRTIELTTTVSSCCEPLTGEFLAFVGLGISGRMGSSDGGVGAGSFEAAARATLVETSLTIEPAA